MRLSRSRLMPRRCRGAKAQSGPLFGQDLCRDMLRYGVVIAMVAGGLRWRIGAVAWFWRTGYCDRCVGPATCRIQHDDLKVPFGSCVIRVIGYCIDALLILPLRGRGRWTGIEPMQSAPGSVFRCVGRRRFLGRVVGFAGNCFAHEPRVGDARGEEDHADCG